MAGDWIKMRANLFSHPKVVRIASALQADTFKTVGGLMSVWCLFDEHTTDGNLVGYTVHTLDDHLRWPGFAAAMRAVSWLEETSEGLVLPEFSTHNGASAKRRAQDADRKRTVRKMSAPEADKKQTREEKRREDISPSQSPARGPHDPEKFQMFHGWQPSAYFPDLAKQSGLKLADAKLAEFVAHWLTQPHQRAQAEWDKALLQSIKHDKLHAESRPGKAKPDNFADKDYGKEITAI